MAASTSRRRATSSTVRAIGPGLSWLTLIGTTPRVGTAPTVGLMPATPLSEAGQVIDPSVSVPIDKGARPAATAAPEPEDEPPGLRSNAHGLPVSPPIADQPDVERTDRILAHSERLVVPRMIPPAARSRATSGASVVAGRLARLVAPAVEGRPATSMLSLTRMGTPCSGPRASVVSHARASSRAVSEMASTLRRAVGDSGASRVAIRSSSSSTSTRAGTPRRRKVNTSAKPRSSSTAGTLERRGRASPCLTDTSPAY